MQLWVASLLADYQEILASWPERRRSQSFRRGRLALGTEYFFVEHIRIVLDVLARRYRALQAMRTKDGVDLGDEIDRVEKFAASLPPRPSRLWALGFGAAVVVLAKLLLSESARFLVAGAKHGSDLANELEKLTNPQVTALRRQCQR
jgi:hypothetical protein